MEEELVKLRADQLNDEEIMSVEDTSFFSYIYSSWLTKYLWKAYRKGITYSDLPSVSYLDSSSYNVQKFENLWNEEIRRRGPTSASLLFVAWRFIRFRFLIACTLNACAQLVKFLLQIFLLRELLQYSEQRNRSFSCASYWIIYIITCDLLQMALYTWSDIMNQRTALRLKSACLCLLFKKIMSVNSTGQRNLDELMNMLSKGSHKIYNAVNFGTSIVNAPVVVICATIYISTHMNPLALLGLMAFLLFYLILYWSGHLISYCEKNANDVTKTRMEKTIEILDNIKLIKIYGWEKHFLRNITNIRKLESKWIWKVTNIKSFMFSMGRAIPIIAFTITFFIEFGCQSTASIAYKVFPICVVYIVQLYESLEALKTSLHRFRGSVSTFKTLKTGLLLEDTSCHAMKPYETSQALAIVNGTFVYDVHKHQKYENHGDEISNVKSNNANDPERRMLLTGTLESRRLEILSNINFKAKKGQLIGICGASGSGKSSLLLAALGQVRMTSGQLLRQGSCAYVSQRPWITNGSVLKNIMFNEPTDSKRYYEAKVVCHIHQEIKNLPDGEMTVIGDRGMKITESMKQRICLARAFHADRDIYCLDDPLSSIEDEISRRIFDELIIQALAEKTVIFVTNKIEHLDRCDYIYIIRDGKIADQGNPRDLRRSKEYAMIFKTSTAIVDAEGDYANEFEELQAEELDEIKGKKEYSINQTNGTDKYQDNNYKNAIDEVNNNVVNENDIELQKIKGMTYYTYAKSIGLLLLLPTLLIYLIHAAVEVFNLIQLTWWIKEIERKDDSKDASYSYYKRWCGISLLLLVLGCVIQSLVSQFAITRITDNMHNSLLEKIINAPARFFDSTSYRIMRGRFLYDLNCVSLSLPSKLDNTLRYIAVVFFTFFVLLSTIPWFTNYVVLTIVFFLYVGKIYRAAQINFKLLENKIKIEIDSFLRNSLQGLSIIRSYKKENDLLIRFQYLVDHNSACSFVRGVSKSWLSSRLEVLTASCLFVASFFTISIQQQISPILFGLTFVYIFQVPSIIKMGIKYLLKMEQCFGSVQNICDYLIALRYDQNNKTISGVTEWSATGCINFDQVQLRSRLDEPYLLDLISFNISNGEKLGILTKTDDEKNAFISAMFRFYDLQGGKITLDGIDISKIDITVLKKQLALIPQDPVFDGTIRYFLDSEKCHDDADLWQALEKMHLKSKVSSVVSQLNCSFNKDIFSVAEKQLLFFARAYLNKIKILLVEENSNIESENTALIQQVIEKEFAESTVLLFARRPKTVLFCDFVLVMDNGGTEEFDYTSNLLNDNNSYLRKLLTEEDSERMRV